MPSPAIATLTKIIELLPDDLQNQVVEHLREYIDQLSDEARWSKSFETTASGLVAAAKKARREIAEGKSQLMDYDQL
jgi:hypothetical protein